jgi:hydrogenase assembly chaperone HypC/HupF
MCLMAPARVVSVEGTLCEVELGGRVDRASMVLEPDLQVGDWVLVNSGTVVRRLDPDQAEEMTRAVALLFSEPEVTSPGTLSETASLERS